MDEPSLHAPAPRATMGQRLILPLFIAGCFVATIVFFCVPRSMADSDIWWHLRDAQLQLSSHSFLTHDLFSFTAAGSPWMDHEWLAELPFYAAFHLIGINGIYFTTLLTIEVIFIGLFYLTYSQSKSIAASSIATILGICLSTVSFGPRTLLYGWVLLVVELLILARSQRHPKIVWALPAVFAIWVNTHGSWLIGIVVFAIFIAANSFTVSKGCIENRAASAPQIKRLLVCWFASVAALFLNPYGWRLVSYPFDLAFRQKLNVANVEEWKSLDFHTPRGRIMFLCLALLFLFQLMRSRKWGLFELGLTAMGLYAGFTYSRFLFLIAILVMPALARSMAPPALAPRRGLSPLIAGALAFLLTCCIVGRVRHPGPDVTQNDARFPNKALPYLAHFQPKGRVFNEFLWGGFLVWNDPQIPVFIDSRVDIFEYNGTLRDYLDIIRPKSSIELFNKYDIQYVLFEKDAPLTYWLKTTHEWKVDYEDETTTLLERITPQKATK
jgi:hypothetical protein